MNQRQTKENELNELKDKLTKLNSELDIIEKSLKRLNLKLVDAKEECENFQPHLEDGKDNLANLQSQLHKSENELTVLQSELTDDEILDLKFIIKKLKKEKIPPASDEVIILTKKDEVLKSNVNKLQGKIISLQEKKAVLKEEINNTENCIVKLQQEEEYRKDRLYKKLYVEFDDDVLLTIFNFFNINKKSEDKLRTLVDKHSKEEIYAFIDTKTEIDKKINKLNESEEKYRNFIINHIEELSKIYSISRYSPKFVDRVINVYPIREVVENIFKRNPNIITSDDDLKPLKIDQDKDVCPYCGNKLYSEKTSGCPYCNHTLENKTKPKVKKTGNWCDNCFTDIPENSEYCPLCGSTNIKIKQQVKKKISKTSSVFANSPIYSKVSSEKICPICYKKIPSSSVRCPNCYHLFKRK